MTNSNRPLTDPFPGLTPLFASLSGVKLDQISSFEVATGVTLHQTFAALLMPSVLAFSPPARSDLPHPGPWMALAGNDASVHVEIELKEAAGSSPFGFDRINAIWFVAFLLRLRMGHRVFVPFISDTPVQDKASTQSRGACLPLELGTVFQFNPPSVSLGQDDLDWIKGNIESAGRLMKEESFNRAARTLDSIWHMGLSSAGIITAWASIETLLRPGNRFITDRVCKALAVLLHPPGRLRDRALTEILGSYTTRGGAVHASEFPDVTEWQKATSLARRAMMKIVENGSLPSIDDLLDDWKRKV
jgi:hypothetical protein